MGGETPADPGRRSRTWSASPARRWRSGRRTTSSPGPGPRTRCSPTARPSAGAGSCPRMLRDVAERDLSTTVLGDRAAGAAAAGADRRPEGRPRGRRAGHGAGGGGRRPADDRQHRLALHDGGDRRGERRGAALVPALLAQRPRAARELRRPRRGRRLRRDRRHRRHLHPRLEAARPAAGLAALPQGSGNANYFQDPVFRAGPRAAARRRTWAPRPAATWASLQPRADLGRPRPAARADLAADPGQGDPARRRRPRGGGPRHRRDRRLQPRRPAGRRRARLARRARRRSPRRSATSSPSSSTAASAAAPTSSRRSPSAPTPSASAAPTSGAWRSTARRGVETVLKMVLAELDLTMALCGYTEPGPARPRGARPSGPRTRSSGRAAGPARPPGRRGGSPARPSARDSSASAASSFSLVRGR